MNIPIQNIYYLLCYAWDKLADKDVVDVKPLDSKTLMDLFAHVLINGTNHLLKRGFDRGYVPVQEWTGRLRGRICFQEAIQKNLLNTPTLPCSFDELSYNVLHNQILKATMRRLIRMPDLEKDNVDRLAQLCRMFSEIEDVEITSQLFRRVQLHRNNQFYDFLLKVCELIHDNLLISEDSGKSKFKDFVRDEGQMRSLFEKFVLNFYHQHGAAYKVKSEHIRWRMYSENEQFQNLLPKMMTDISLTSATRKIIIDCKYTPNSMGIHYRSEKETLRSEHLYQIHAYMSNLKEGGLNDECEMMLLYPTVTNDFSATYFEKKHKISIRSINLNQDWQGIHNDLLALVA